MKGVIALATMVCLSAQPTLANAKDQRAQRQAARQLPVGTIPSDFDLARHDNRRVAAEDAIPTDPLTPRGADLRAFSWVPPGVEYSPIEGGPVIAVGAMGTRYKGMPKLAHVGIDWDF